MADWAEGNGHPPARLPPRRAGRRRSLITLVVLLVALPVSFIVSVIAGEDWRRVASAEDLSDQEIIYLAGLRIFVVQTEDGPLAVSALSPQGDRVLFCPFADAFQSAEGALFDRRGLYLAGPATQGLTRVAVRVREGYVEVDPSQTAPGPALTGAREDVSGRLCRVPGPEDPPGFAAVRQAEG